MAANSIQGNNSEKKRSTPDSEVFRNANIITRDTHDLRVSNEALPHFKQTTVDLTVAALNLIALKAGDDQAEEVLREIVSKFSGSQVTPTATELSKLVM